MVSEHREDKGLNEEQQQSWDDNGYVLVRGFADEATITAMIDRIVGIAREIDAGDERDDLIVSPESLLADAPTAEGRLSKIFRIMRAEDVFFEFATRPDLLGLVADLIGPDVDCFLSQFIFKHPGALGQPWHQDDYYFRMTPLPQVGVWLACTAATMDNGPLWIVPGSHAEPIHDAVRDPREGANLGYVEIVDADTSAEEPVLMAPGDLLIFHSHLRHRSTDNVSDGMRAAMVYHYASAHTEGARIFNHDWTEVRRGGEPVAAARERIPVDWGGPTPS